MGDCLASESVPDPLEDRLLSVLPRLRAHLSSRRPALGQGEVDDVAQEVVARALHYRGSFDSSRALWPWLRRTAEHVLHDQHRASTRRPALSRDIDPAAPEELAGLDARDEIERMLAPLNARERTVLLRFHREEQPVRTIAAELGLPEGTVKSHLSRARRRLAGWTLGDETSRRPK